LQPRQKQSDVLSRVFALDAGAAAQWLSLAVELWRATRPDLLCALVRHCWAWTAGANGIGCGPDEEPGDLSFEWNDAYFTAALAAAVSIGDGGIEEYVLKPLAQLPEEPLFDAMEAVLHALDPLWLDGKVVSDSTAVSIRETLAQQLVATQRWRRSASKCSSGIELHVAGAVAAMFMGQHNIGRGPCCYVHPLGAARTALLLSLLTPLTEQASGSMFVAFAFLSLLEVEPHADRLKFMARAVVAWWQMQGANAEFWIEYGVGERVCNWVGKAVLDAPVSPAVLDGAELKAIVDILAQCGTPLARALEERLAAHGACWCRDRFVVVTGWRGADEAGQIQAV